MIVYFMSVTELLLCSVCNERKKAIHGHSGDIKLYHSSYKWAAKAFNSQWYTQLQSSPLFHQIIGSLVIVNKSSIFLPCFSYFLAIFRKEVETLSRSPRKIILCSLAYLCICTRRGHTKITHSCWILPIARSHQPPSGSYAYGHAVQRRVIVIIWK